MAIQDSVFLDLYWCVPGPVLCTAEKLLLGSASPTMKTFPLLASPAVCKYEQLWPTRAQELSWGRGVVRGIVKVYHVAFLGMSPGSKTGSSFMVSCGSLGCSWAYVIIF